MLEENVKILVLENGNSHNQATQKAFSKCGANCTVEFATNNGSLLETLSVQRFDMAFINAEVYKSIGTPLLAALQTKEKYISLIYILDKTDASFAKTVMAERASNCITRNYVVPDVLDVLINQSIIIRQTEITIQNMITENMTSNELNFFTRRFYGLQKYLSLL